LNGLGEALKAMNARLDDQTALERKAFADSKVQMDSVGGDLRVVREKVDETNVRLSSLSQELDSLRSSMPEPAAQPPIDVMTPPSPDGTPGVPSASAPVTNPGIAPQRLFNTARADYSTGDYSLAIKGFESYLKYFPKNVDAVEAQLGIGDSYRMDGKNAEAVPAYDQVIANYPGSSFLPQAYYKRGLSLAILGKLDEAKQSFETVIKQFPDSSEATLAKQALDRLNRPAR
jgi:tol-pal system protein YbgF